MHVDGHADRVRQCAVLEEISQQHYSPFGQSWQQIFIPVLLRKIVGNI